jgi:hypothetical protein
LGREFCDVVSAEMSLWRGICWLGCARSYHLPAFGDEDIRRLDVTVDDSLAVRASSALAIWIAMSSRVSVPRGRPVMWCFRLTKEVCVANLQRIFKELKKEKQRAQKEVERLEEALTAFGKLFGKSAAKAGPDEYRPRDERE